MAFWHRRKPENRALTAETAYPLLVTSAKFGASITASQALKVGDVYAAVKLLADSISSLPVHVFRKTTDGRERVEGGALFDLLEQPGPAVSQADLVSQIVTHLCIYGNAYLGKYRQAGQVVQLSPLDPERIDPEIVGGKPLYRYHPPYGEQQTLSTEDVVHIRALSVDGLLGVSPVQQCARVLNLSDELVTHAINYFDTGSIHPAGILKMAPEAAFADRERETERMRAEAKPHGVLVVQGDADYMQIAEAMDDQQFVEQRRLAAQEVARVFRIPPHMIGAPSADSMTYSNVEQESIEFVRYSLTPWLRRIELALSNDADLASQRQFVKFEVDGLLRADARTRAEVYEKAIVNGWLDVNEVRALEDLSPRTAEPASTNGTSTNGTARIAEARALKEIGIPDVEAWRVAGYSEAEIDEMAVAKWTEHFREEMAATDHFKDDKASPVEVTSSNGKRN